MMSVFLGEFYRLNGARRLLLAGLALLFALGGNYGRLLFLAWQGAHGGISTVEALHDSAGFGILAFTVPGLWLMSLFLRGPETIRRRRTPLPELAFAGHARGATLWAAGLFLCAICGEGFTQGWYAWRAETAARSPAWTVEWPVSAPHFEKLALAPATVEVLQADEAKAAAWNDASGWHWHAIWLKYRPRPGNKIVFASHNPEICLPGAGLHETRDDGEFTHTVQGLLLPIHAYLFTSGATGHYVFWITYQNRGRASDFDQRKSVYDHSLGGILERSLSWAQDIWLGSRGTDAQTLEVMVTGPSDRAQATRAYAAFLDRAVVPDTDPGTRLVSP